MVGVTEDRGKDSEGNGVSEDGAEGDGRRLDWWEVVKSGHCDDWTGCRSVWKIERLLDLMDEGSDMWMEEQEVREKGGFEGVASKASHAMAEAGDV